MRSPPSHRSCAMIETYITLAILGGLILLVW